MTDPIRLDKRLTSLIGCSRGDAQRYIEGGWVTVNGTVVEQPQAMVTDEVMVLRDNAEATRAETVTMLLHKPAGMPAADMCAMVTPDSRSELDATGVALLQRHFHGLQLAMPLPAEDSGLVVVSQDGRVVSYLKDRGATLEQEYLVEVTGELAPYGMRRLAHGLSFRNWPLPPCKVSWQNETRLRFAIKPVHPGQLRDMCGQVGLEAVSVRRLRVGRVALGKLAPGQWRYLAPDERF
ncbi:rRNA pseudouridine synthase [Stenotrophomonas aracearum]|jgi:23S rRNA pseudouridine2604 synthase|uniref:Dual-specificity RNA pseudouridine synthase RluF n=1 Tax=Stenotrophomonas aracearum TaxID=3003272 RepID=A0ABY9YAM4_9GAMM|nr:rRNA pseudouridine synthase [Stenotrophomonas sp. A5588]WNH47752.1 rRNA pseudouridine synthase [Stenotrophomonas sp. A5588]